MNTKLNMKLFHSQSFTKIKTILYPKRYFSLVPLTILFVFAIFSFRPTTVLSEFQKNITFDINGKIWQSNQIMDASISISNQTKDIYAKTLNINGVDANGSSIAITVFDVQNATVGECLTLGTYYGQEHESVQKNFTFDIGIASFSNKCNLIFQSSDDELLSSRNGVVTIENCDNGKVTGSFEFKTDSGVVFSKGKFVDVLFDFSK